MRVVQWAGFILGGAALLGFLGSAFDPARAQDDAFYGSAAPILLGVGALGLLRRNRARLNGGITIALFASVVVLAVGLSVVGNQLPGRLAATYRASTHVDVSGDTTTADFIAKGGVLRSDSSKETTLTLTLTRESENSSWFPDLTATFNDADGTEQDCFYDPDRSMFWGADRGQDDTVDLDCDYISQEQMSGVKSVSLTAK